MTNTFEDVMSKRTDAELLKILNASADEYQEAALEAAKKEFEKRNLSLEQVAIIKTTIETDREEKESKANEPLAGGWKVLTFVIPGVTQLLLSGLVKAEGYDRKAYELGRWTLYGFGFYFGLMVLISLW